MPGSEKPPLKREATRKRVVKPRPKAKGNSGGGRPRKPNTPRLFNAKARARYLENLALTGLVTQSAEAAGVARQTVYVYREAHPEFAKEEDDAREQHRDLVAGEVLRRGVEGWEEPVFGSLGGQFSGSGQIGVVRKHSDKMLELLIKKLDPSFHTSVKVDQRTQHSGVVAGPSSMDTSKLTNDEKLVFLSLLDKMTDNEEEEEADG